MKIILTLLLILSSTVGARQEQSLPTESWNVPETVSKAFAAKKLDKRYEFSFHLNPFYLRGDFNGDGKPDIAILVKEKVSGKIGIAILHSGTNEVLFIGSGTEGSKGGDNFDWMDYWYVYPKGVVHRGVGERTVPHLIGEALLVGRSEAASGLFYWNGKRYLWYQQGD